MKPEGERCLFPPTKRDKICDSACSCHFLSGSTGSSQYVNLACMFVTLLCSQPSFMHCGEHRSRDINSASREVEATLVKQCVG